MTQDRSQNPLTTEEQIALSGGAPKSPVEGAIPSNNDEARIKRPAEAPLHTMEKADGDEMEGEEGEAVKVPEGARMTPPTHKQ